MTCQHIDDNLSQAPTQVLAPTHLEHNGKRNLSPSATNLQVYRPLQQPLKHFLAFARCKQSKTRHFLLLVLQGDGVHQLQLCSGFAVPLQSSP